MVTNDPVDLLNTFLKKIITEVQIRLKMYMGSMYHTLPRWKTPLNMWLLPNTKPKPKNPIFSEENSFKKPYNREFRDDECRKQKESKIVS